MVPRVRPARRVRLTAAAVCALAVLAGALVVPASSRPSGRPSDVAGPPLVPTGPVTWSQEWGQTQTQCADGLLRSSAGQSSFSLAGEGADRCESIPSMPELSEGTDLWFTFETMVDPGFPTVAGWQVLAQLKNDGSGSPPVSLAVEQGGSQYVLTGGFGHPDGSRHYQLRLGPVQPGAWVSWAMHVHFSTDPSRGAVSVVRDGVLLVDAYRPAGGTIYPARSTSGADPNSAEVAIDYLKFGYYRDATMTIPATVHHRGWSVIGHLPTAQEQLFTRNGA
jgi:hypothetical protein